MVSPMTIRPQRKGPPKVTYRTGGTMDDYIAGMESPLAGNMPYVSTPPGPGGDLAGNRPYVPSPPRPGGDIQLVGGRWPGVGMPLNMGGPGAPQAQIGNYMVPGGMAPKLPVNNPYVTGAAPIQQRAARVQAYANSFPQAQAAGVPGGGLLTNAQAGELYQQSGYMPSVTIGGRWGQLPVGRHPMAGLSTKQQKDIMRIRAQPAPAAPQLSQPMSNAEAEAFAGRVDPLTGRSRGLETVKGSDLDPRRYQMLLRQGVISGPDDVVGLRASTGLHDSLAGRGLIQGQPNQEQLDMNRAAYQQRRGAEMSARQGLVQDRAARNSARREEALANRNQPMSMMDQIAMQNPRVALGIMQLRQQGRIAEAEILARQAGLSLQEAEMKQRGELGRGELEVRRTEAANRQMQLANDSRRQEEQDALGRVDTMAGIMRAIAEAKAAGRHQEARSMEQLLGTMRGGATPGDAASAPAVDSGTASAMAEASGAYAGKSGRELFESLGVPLDALAALGSNPDPASVRAIAEQYGLNPDLLGQAASYRPWFGYDAPAVDPTGYQSPAGMSMIVPWMLSGEGASAFGTRRRRQSAAMRAMPIIGG